MKERKRERNKERNKEKQKTLLISHNYNKLDFTLIIIHHILYAIFLHVIRSALYMRIYWGVNKRVSE